MIELPEAIILANQLKRLVGKTITKVIFNQSVHKLVWFYKNGINYEETLLNKKIIQTKSVGGQVVIQFEGGKLVLGDGINIRYNPLQEPAKHQLGLELDKKDNLFFFAQMYGGIVCYKDDEEEYLYYQIAKDKPDPLSNAFDLNYWESLFEENENLSLKAFLATNQRIPGIGNGVLQDILWQAKLHPKQKISTLSAEDKIKLYQSLKKTLKAMVDQNGRSSEKDMDGNNGLYEQFSRFSTCPICNNTIVKEAYLGGSIYYCPSCQPLKERSKR